MGGRGWLIFQVVTDRVLTHRGFTALDVLAIGLITVSIFETVLGAPRTYVFAHTTNRIDVELGARLLRCRSPISRPGAEAGQHGEAVVSFSQALKLNPSYHTAAGATSLELFPGVRVAWRTAL
jgi:ABC-type protease/lipase transport system fused ATPase/permease subunit